MKIPKLCILALLLTGGKLIAQEKQVVFKGVTKDKAYDGYAIKLYLNDQIEDIPAVEVKVQNNQFEIRAPFRGPATYYFQNGYELEEKGGYSPYGILVEKAGTIHIDAEMNQLIKSSTKGSNAQNVKEKFNRMIDEKTEPYKQKWREMYGAALVDSPEQHMNDPKMGEYFAALENFVNNQGKENARSTLMELAVQYPGSLAIPALTLEQQMLTLDERVKIYSGLTAENKKSVYGKRLNEEILVAQKSSVGVQIPDFSLPNVDNKTLQLSQLLQGKKYLFIDFWASWCSPCRAEISNLKKIYQEFQGKGLEVWGISTDQRRENWVNALKEDQPNWPQAWDGGKKDEKVSNKLFYVPYLPSTYLLDAEGKIIARDLRGEALKEKLTALLGS